MKYFFTLILTLYGLSTAAQGENNFWVFGARAGLDFNGGVGPFTSAIGGGNMEACAAVSNAAGQLLFYTNGSRVWNRMNNLMPGGNTLHGRSGSVTESAQHGAQIVPVIGEPGKYYIFSLTEWEAHANNYGGRLFYSVVDMSLNGGLGDIDPSRKWVPVDFNLSEKMIAVPGGACNIWLVVHDLDTNMFKAYEITAAGVNTAPVRSYAGIHGSLPGPAGNTSTTRNRWWNVGQLTASPDRTKLATANLAPGYVEVFDFNDVTGQVSNGFVVDTILQLTGGNSFCGVAFSPDNSKLYSSGAREPANQPNNNRHIYQYNMLAAGGSAAIRASRTLVGICGVNSHLRQGPDERIYFLHNSYTDSVGVIAAPNQPVPACLHRTREVVLNTGTHSYFTLGNNYVMPKQQDTTFHRQPDVLLCAGSTIQLSGRSGFNQYVWDDGSTDSVRTVGTEGTYFVLNADNCNSRIDTFVVRYRSVDSVYHRIDTFLCAGSVLELSGRPGYSDYLWDDGSTDSVRVIQTTGVYYVLNTDTCHSAADTFVVTLRQPDSIVRRIDTVMCASGTLELGVSAATAIWEDGSTDPVRTITRAGVYIATYIRSQECISYTDSFYVGEIDLSFDLGSDTVICGSGTYVLAPAMPVADVAYKWQDGSTGSSITVGASGSYHLEVSHGACVSADSIHIRFIDLRPNLGNDTMICLSEIGRFQLRAEIPEQMHAFWSDGSQGSTYTVPAAGAYWLSFAEEGCVVSDTVVVNTELCTCAASAYPSAFTPNGDGRNDVFRLVYEPGCLISEYSLRVYDRWGRTIFMSTDPTLGWDGLDGGVPADLGTYMYTASFKAGSSGEQRALKGDVALVR